MSKSLNDISQHLMGNNNKSTEDKRALKNCLYQFELGEKCSDQQ